MTWRSMGVDFVSIIMQSAAAVRAPIAATTPATRSLIALDPTVP
jgi:hypothetical protein